MFDLKNIFLDVFTLRRDKVYWVVSDDSEIDLNRMIGKHFNSVIEWYDLKELLFCLDVGVDGGTVYFRGKHYTTDRKDEIRAERIDSEEAYKIMRGRCGKIDL